MTTLFMDYLGGNDANDGLSFANRVKTFTNGLTAARIAPGDICRIAKSPDPTSLGNGTWTTGPLGAEVGITSSTNATPIVVTLSSGAYASLAPAVGDTVVIQSHTTNTNANGVWTISAIDGVNFKITLVNADGSNSVGNGAGGATGTVRKYTNCVVTLASALTTTIACVGNRGALTNWTASANVTCTINTSDYKEGGECQDIEIGASFTTGKAAYFATGTLDLSAYQQVTFYVKQTSGPVATSGDYMLRLCTDTTGDTPVHDIPIPALVVNDRWVPVTVDLATNLNSSIKSINFTVNVDQGAARFLIDDVVACKASASADSLSLISLIGKNTAGEAPYTIMSINDVRVMIGFITNTIPNSTDNYRGYYGTTETVTTYKYDTIPTDMVAAATTAVGTLQDSGSAGSPITFSGGWDTSGSMTTQNGETYFDGRNGLGRGIIGTNKVYLSFERIHTYRYSTGYYLNGGDHYVFTGAIHSGNNTIYGIINDVSLVNSFEDTITNLNGNDGFEMLSAYGITHTGTLTAHGCGVAGLMMNANSASVYGNNFGTIKCSNNVDDGIGSQQLASLGGVHYNYFGIATTNGNGGDGVDLTGHSYNQIGSLTTNNNKGRGINLSGIAHDNYVWGGSSTGNVGTGMVGVSGTLPSRNYFHDFTVNDATVTSTRNAGSNVQVRFENYGGVAGDNRVFTDGGSIVSQTAVRHTASGIAWQLSPTDAERTSYNPLFLSLCRRLCIANVPITFTAWFRRSNTAVTGMLVCPASQLAGIGNVPVTDSMTAAADTWEQLSITFTPTETGVVEIQAWAYGGTTHSVYVDDMSISP